jgi:hypothetical protein
MRRFALSAFALLCAPVALLAQSGSQAQQREALIRIEREIAQANFDCDYRYFERVEATEFTFTDANGAVSNRKEDLAGEATCKKSTAKATIDSADVRLYGTTAVVVARSTINSTSRDGQPVTRRSRFTDVFVWRDGRWQLVAGHSSRIPSAPLTPPTPPAAPPAAPSTFINVDSIPNGDLLDIEIVRAGGPGDLLGATRRHQLLDSLTQQQRRWDETRPPEYRIRVVEISDCMSIDARKGPRMWSRSIVRDTLVIGRESEPLDPRYEGRCLHEMRVEDLFRQLARALADTTAYVHDGIQYDLVYGFPRSYWISSSMERGSGTLVETFVPAPLR